jgi:hypothetical protein
LTRLPVVLWWVCPMKQHIPEFTHRFFASLPFTVCWLIVLSVIALRFAHTTYAKTNPYLPYLRYTSDIIYDLTTNCYGDVYASHLHTTCTMHNDDGYTTFAFLETGQVRSISFWREAEQAHVGDFVAWYGAPNKVYHSSRWTGYTWYLDGFRLIIQSRDDDLYALATLVIYSVTR